MSQASRQQPKHKKLHGTGPLGSGRQHPPPAIVPTPQLHLHDRTGDVPDYLLVQISAQDGSITTLGLQVKPELVIGRVDPNTGFTPDLDLTPYGAKEAGVSRRHLHIFHNEQKLYLQDNGSRNGTSLNNTKVQPDEPHPLHDGDFLVLGRLPLTLYFVFD